MDRECTSVGGSGRLQQDLTALQQVGMVRYDETTRAVVLENVELPRGWTPRVVTVRLELAEHHPQAPPKVVFPGEIRCHGVVPRYWLTSGRWLVRGHLGDPIIYYPEWGENHTLTALVDTLVEELAAVGGPAVGEGDDA